MVANAADARHAAVESRSRGPQIFVVGHPASGTAWACRVVSELERAEAIVVAGVDMIDAPEFAALQGRTGSRPVVVIAEDAAATNLKVVRGLLARGVTGVVAASNATSALVPVLRASAEGHLVVPIGARTLFGTPSFTVREKQVLAMVVLGCSNHEIASRLFVAETTVKSHLSSVFAKLGVRTRREAAAAILDPSNGLGTGILTISGEEREGR